jgi:hypothetical protein
MQHRLVIIVAEQDDICCSFESIGNQLGCIRGVIHPIGIAWNFHGMKIIGILYSDLFVGPIHFCFCLSELLADLFYPGPAGRRPVGPLLCCSVALLLCR